MISILSGVHHIILMVQYYQSFDQMIKAQLAHVVPVTKIDDDKIT